MNTWLVIGVMVVCTAAIIAHNEYKHRQTTKQIIEWLDAIGNMISDFTSRGETNDDQE